MTGPAAIAPLGESVMAETTVESVCCPPFDPVHWREREWTWHEKLFVRDRVRSVMHIPLNFGAVMTRNRLRIDAEQAGTPEQLVLADEVSLFATDLYLEVTKAVPGASMARLSGDFLAQPFEGAYRAIPNWIKVMRGLVAERGKELKHLYFYYPLCPTCAAHYGKNYVVIIAQI